MLILPTILSLLFILCDCGSIACGENQCIGKTINCTDGSACFVTCSINGCDSATINCVDGYDCTISIDGVRSAISSTINGNLATKLYVNTGATGDFQLQNAHIYCPINGECHIYCKGGTSEVCGGTNIHAESCSAFTLRCEQNNNACFQVHVWCPKYNTCILIGEPSSTAAMTQMKIYSAQGFNTVIVEKGNTGISIGTMYCMTNYSLSCLIDGTDNTQCLTSHICDNPPLLTSTGSPTLMPSTIPTTLNPTTLMPSTNEPTSLTPTTKQPTTNNPTTYSPTTSVPTTTSSTTNNPTTFSPTTNTPTTSNPTAVPTTSIPTTTNPTPFIPTTAIPTTMVPTTNNPTTYSPTTNGPTTTNPTTFTPTTSDPTTYSPTTSNPTTNNPTTNQPTTNNPTTNTPTTAEPSTSIPTTFTPTTTVPTTGYPTKAPIQTIDYIITIEYHDSDDNDNTELDKDTIESILIAKLNITSTNIISTTINDGTITVQISVPNNVNLDKDDMNDRIEKEIEDTYDDIDIDVNIYKDGENINTESAKQNNQAKEYLNNPFILILMIAVVVLCCMSCLFFILYIRSKKKKQRAMMHMGEHDLELAPTAITKVASVSLNGEGTAHQNMITTTTMTPSTDMQTNGTDIGQWNTIGPGYVDTNMGDTSVLPAEIEENENESENKNDTDDTDDIDGKMDDDMYTTPLKKETAGGPFKGDNNDNDDGMDMLYMKGNNKTPKQKIIENDENDDEEDDDDTDNDQMYQKKVTVGNTRK